MHRASTVVVAAAALLVTVSACASTRPLSSLGHLRPAPAPGRVGPELIPIPDAPVLAPGTSKATPTMEVDGIRCQRNERVAFHIHAHLTVFVNGKARQVPAGIGVWPTLQPQSSKYGQFVVTQNECFAWLITRFPDGLIHIEAPVKRSFVLGELFDVWGQPLGPTRVGPARGPVTAIVNGKVWTGDPRRIPLTSHAQIQLEVGTPLVAPEKVTFPGTF